MKKLWALVRSKFSAIWKTARKFFTKKVVPVIGKVIPVKTKAKGAAAIFGKIAKIFTLKRVLLVAAVALVVVAICYGIGLGKGSAAGAV